MYGIDITNNVTAMARLDWEVEKAKIALSTHEDTTIWLDELWPGINLRQIFTRAQFEEMTESLVRAFRTYVFALAHLLLAPPNNGNNWQHPQGERYQQGLY